MKATDVVRAFAADKHGKPGQVALAWLLHRGDDIVPIPGTKRLSYLEENIAAVEASLSADDMARIDSALPPESISGPRCTPQMMATIDR